MSNTDHRIEDVFHAALEFHSPAERNDYLEKSCFNDPDLRMQVDRLLQAHDKAGKFLEQPPEFPSLPPARVTETDLTLPPKKFIENDIRIDNQLPCTFGDYELLEEIAHGGMGVVFKARQVSLNRIVAIKMILTGQLAGKDVIKRFRIEAEAAGKLDHSGIVPVFDVGCHQGRHYFSMAFVEGSSLSARIKEGPLPPREAAVMARKIANAMQVAHDRGVVHRDLKPGNVLLNEQSEPRVTDFGLAKRVDGDSNLTMTGMVLGTPSYMPPEQAAGKEIAAAADVYSLGAILYAMLTGGPPFRADSQLDTILQVLHQEPKPPRKIDKSIPKDLEVICLKCLEKEPAHRYLTAADLSADLRRFLSGEPIQAKNDLRRRFRKWSIREPVLAAHVVATVIMIAILVINYLLFHERGNRQYNLQMLGINIGILAGWACVVLVLQKTQNVLQTKSAIPYAWAAINPIFATIALAFNDAPRELLLSLYFLLMVFCCFFRRVELVAISTVASIIGYLVLASWFLDESLRESPSYVVIFGVNMAVVGSLLGMLTIRMKRLGEQNSA